MNWHERIGAADKRRGFTFDDVDLAGKWPTCACGEQDPRIPRTGSGRGAPVDKKLRVLGNTFYEAIRGDDFGGARETLAAIERRAAEVLAGLEER